MGDTTKSSLFSSSLVSLTGEQPWSQSQFCDTPRASPGAPHNPGFSPTGISRSGVLTWVELFSESFSVNICSVPAPSLRGPVPAAHPAQGCQEQPGFLKCMNPQHPPAQTLDIEHSASATKTQPLHGEGTVSLCFANKGKPRAKVQVNIVTPKSNAHCEQDLTSEAEHRA